MALIDSLVSYWKLDEASGDAIDAHGDNNLDDINTVGSTTGKINNGREFELDRNEYFSHTDNTDLSTGDIDFTIQAWVNVYSTSSFPVVISKGTAGEREYIIYLNGGEVRWVVGTTEVDSNVTLSTATWYHIVAWHDSVNNEIGIAINNGTPVTTAHSTGAPDTTHPFELGASTSQSLYWDGILDEVGFWKNRVLNSSDIAELYNGGSGLSYDAFGGAEVEQNIPNAQLQFLSMRGYSRR